MIPAEISFNNMQIKHQIFYNELLKLILAVSILCLPLAGVCTTAIAQTSDANAVLPDSIVTRHAIIAFDDAVPQYFKVMLLNKKLIFSKLKAALETGNNGMPLLHESDFYSVVDFAIGDKNRSISDFVQPIKIGKKKLAWNKYESISQLSINLGNWGAQVYGQGLARVKGRPFSLLTGIRAFTMKALFSNTLQHVANRTYMLIVTDDHYNGNDDFNKEFTTIPNPFKQKWNFPAVCQYAAENYLFHRLSTFTIYKDYKIYVYEVLPSASFGLNYVMNYPADMGIRRVRGGYRIYFPTNEVDKMYKISKLSLEVKCGGSIIAYHEYKHGENVDMLLKTSHLRSDSIEVNLRGWILRQDGFYNGVEMSPWDSHFPRLTDNRTLPLEAKEKVLGIFSLPDLMWWWFPNDLKEATALWDIVFFLILIALVLYVGYKYYIYITRYIPTNSQIHISYMATHNQSISNTKEVEKIESQRENIIKKQKDRIELENKLKETEDLAYKTMEEKEKIEDKLKIVELENKKLLDSISDFHERKNNMEQHIIETKEDYREMRQESHAMKQELNKAMIEKNEVKKELTKIEEKNKEMQYMLQARESEFHARESKLHNMESELHSRESALKEKEHELMKMKSELIKLKSKLSETKQ